MTAGGVLAFADRLDLLLTALGTLGAVADGCSYNLLLVFASDVVNSLGRGHAAAQQGGASATATSCVRFMRDVEKVRSLVVRTHAAFDLTPSSISRSVHV
jgi:ATP-binding cassette, subfamily B (MDR/TAP), member 1